MQTISGSTPSFALNKQRPKRPPPHNNGLRAAFNEEEEEDEEEQRRLGDLCFPKQQSNEEDVAEALAASLQSAAVGECDHAPATAASSTAEANKEARAATLTERGNVAAEAGDMVTALQLFEQAIGLLGPTTTGRGLKARLWECKAQCHLQLEEYLEAVKAAERAVELSDAQWPEARLTLGRCLLQFGEVRAAVKVLTELFRSEPANEEVREDLIEANAVLGELMRREADFDLQLSGRAGLDAKELEVCACKRNLLARGLDVQSDCTLGWTEEEESAAALDRARREEEAMEQGEGEEEGEEGAMPGRIIGWGSGAHAGT